MKSSKKSVAGHAVSLSLLNGESGMANKDSSAGTAEFYLPVMLLSGGIKTVLCGLKNGYWSGRRMLR
jgi:hypothetical protein